MVNCMGYLNQVLTWIGASNGHRCEVPNDANISSPDRFWILRKPDRHHWCVLVFGSNVCRWMQLVQQALWLRGLCPLCCTIPCSHAGVKKWPLSVVFKITRVFKNNSHFVKERILKKFASRKHVSRKRVFWEKTCFKKACFEKTCILREQIQGQ